MQGADYQPHRMVDVITNRLYYKKNGEQRESEKNPTKLLEETKV